MTTTNSSGLLGGPNNHTPFLLVDVSYLSFYRFFSTQIWYHKLHPEANYDENYDWTTNMEFMNRFTQNYMSSVDRFRARYNIPYSNVVFCRDCPRDNIWRLSVFPSYKSNRKTICRFMNRKFQVGPVFRNIYQNLIPQLEQRHGFHVFKVDNAEGDDLIAVLTRTIQNLAPHRWIFILTNDHDYLQLSGQRIHIWSLQNHLLNRRLRESSNHMLEWKIWTGDPSDSIPPVYESITWEQIMEFCSINGDKKKEEWFQEHPTHRELYERNKKLIDFYQIPAEIQVKIIYQATPLFVGSTALAMNWGWNGPNVAPPPGFSIIPEHPQAQQQVVQETKRRPVLNYRKRTNSPPKGMLQKSGHIHWFHNQ